MRAASVFAEVDDLLAALDAASPSHAHTDSALASQGRGDELYVGRRVSWVGHRGLCVLVPVEHLLFMEGNLWNFRHAAALVETARRGERPTWGVPAGRVHRVTAAEVRSTERYEREGELAYQTGMVRPWSKAEVGTYYAKLVDGNHRALAALALGEDAVPVYVSENYRENVRKGDYV